MLESYGGPSDLEMVTSQLKWNEKKYFKNIDVNSRSFAQIFLSKICSDKDFYIIKLLELIDKRVQAPSSIVR